MSRPGAEILTTIQDQYHTITILKADAIWAVYYQNKPINIRASGTLLYIPIKYKKASFSNSGHAIALAKRLNKQFNTKDFTVVKLTHAETIFSE